VASLACASNESVTFSGKLEQLYAYFSTAGEDARIFGAVATEAVEKRRRSTLGGLWSTGSLKKLVMMKEARTPPMSRDDRSPVDAAIRIDGSSENDRLSHEDGGRYALIGKHTCCSNEACDTSALAARAVVVAPQLGADTAETRERYLCASRSAVLGRSIESVRGGFGDGTPELLASTARSEGLFLQYDASLERVCVRLPILEVARSDYSYEDPEQPRE
jgi:hypothetical protein